MRRKRVSAEGAFFKKENNAEQIFFGEYTPQPFFQQSGVAVQRKCEDCEKEDKAVKRKPELKSEEEEDPKKKVEPEKKDEEKKLQKKDAGSQTSGAWHTPAYLNSLRGQGNVLPVATQAFFHNRTGHDFRDVEIHTGAEAEASAKEMSAKAYTYGKHIVFNKDEYNPDTYEGKKLLAHELVHTLQQNRSALLKKDKDEPEQQCSAGSVDLEALTTAGFKKNAGNVVDEKTKKSKGCPACEDECVTITGTLKVPFSVNTKINLPPVPANLTPCQQGRVRAAINGPLLKHENQHVKAFETFNGTASLSVNYTGCESDYSSYREDLAEKEFKQRKASAEAKSSALDPFSVPVDLCCIDKPAK